MRSPRPPVSPSPPLLLFATLLLVACGDRLPRPSAETPVILISIDTLRSDHLPAYGYTGVQTPNIDALRDDSVLYQRAYSHCPLTLPSHANVFTGLLPSETGIRDNTGYTLNTNVKTLAEILKGRGYATGGAVSSYVLRRETGISRGFDFYDDDVGTERGLSIAAIQRTGDETVNVSIPWISTNRTKPLFFFLHLYEPHTPYTPPDQFRGRYTPYDAEIASADAIVGTFVQHLKNTGLYDRALIVLFSDHGEGLNDHGEEEHGVFLYREALQVPLLVKLPESRLGGSSVATAVQLSDIFPTVLEQTATPPVQREKATSVSLLGFIGKKDVPDRAIYSETYFPKFHFGWSDLHSLISGRHHFIQAPESELYDLENDSRETSNILRDNRRVFASMRKMIEPLIRAAEAPAAMDPEEAEKLAALGYLGSAAPTEGPLPDPKTKKETFKRIRQAFKMFRAGEYEEALAYYQDLLKENPRMVDMWDVSARALLRLGRKEEAVAAAKEGLKIAPNATSLALMVTDVQTDLGNLKDAEQHAELAVKTNPAQAHAALARIALARGDLGRAEKEANLALGVDKDRVRALITLARVEKQKNNFEAALKRLDEAGEILKAKKGGGITTFHFLRGDVLARLGRTAEAEAEFRREIELFPDEPQAYKNLILLYVTEGRLPEATQLIYALEKASPTPPAYAAISETLGVVGDRRGARFWALRGLKKFPDNRMLRRLAS